MYIKPLLFQNISDELSEYDYCITPIKAPIASPTIHGCGEYELIDLEVLKESFILNIGRQTHIFTMTLPKLIDFISENFDSNSDTVQSYQANDRYIDSLHDQYDTIIEDLSSDEFLDENCNPLEDFSEFISDFHHHLLAVCDCEFFDTRLYKENVAELNTILNFFYQEFIPQLQTEITIHNSKEIYQKALLMYRRLVKLQCHL